MEWWVELATSGFGGFIVAGFIALAALCVVLCVLGLVLRALGRPGLWDASINGYREGRDQSLRESGRRRD